MGEEKKEGGSGREGKMTWQGKTKTRLLLLCSPFSLLSPSFFFFFFGFKKDYY